MDATPPLHALAAGLGVHTRYQDGLGTAVMAGDETLVRLCAALGAPLASVADASDALRWLEARDAARRLPPVLVAWDGVLPSVAVDAPSEWTLTLEDGTDLPLSPDPTGLRAGEPLPLGYHRLTVSRGGALEHATVIAAPRRAWRQRPERRTWGIATHLAALRSTRSRAVGDLHDLETTCRWVRHHGGDLVTVLPLLPTFNDPPAEPSPYAPVSRLFWSELVLDLGDRHRPVPATDRLDVIRAAREVRDALLPTSPAMERVDSELLEYARFRGAQVRLGRDWRSWPGAAREGQLGDDQVDGEEMRFHLAAQLAVRDQVEQLRDRLDTLGVRLGLDLAVGVHPDGYDPWSRRQLFATGISVGAPPDPGFPSGQDWGFPPVLPTASRAEGHGYLAAALRHQARLAGVLRIDHVMAFQRLYWIPQGMSLDQGSYVNYPVEELFAIASLESQRHQCELVGENLGTVPEAMQAAMERHRVWGMYVAQFAAHGDPVEEPTASEVASIGTHDTPTFAGWLGGTDIPERLALGLLTARSAPREQARRADAVVRLAHHLGVSAREPGVMLDALLGWLGASASPLVIAWLEDLWLEPEGVNLPGTSSAARPNWQRPMARLLEEALADADVARRVRSLAAARSDVPDPDSHSR